MSIFIRPILRLIGISFVVTLLFIIGPTPQPVDAHITGSIFGTAVQGEFVRTAADDKFPFSVFSMRVFDKSSSNEVPKTFPNSLQVGAATGSQGNLPFFKYECELTSGQSAGSNIALAKTETTKLTYAYDSKAGAATVAVDNFFSTFYASAHSGIKLYSYLRVVNQTLKFKPPGSDTYSVDVASRIYTAADVLAGKGIMIGTNTGGADQAHITNKIPWTTSSDTTPFILGQVFFPNVGILNGNFQSTVYGLNFSKLVAPSKIKVDLYRISNSDWEAKKSDTPLFKRVSTFEVLPQKAVNVIYIPETMFVKYVFPKTIIWDVVQESDKDFNRAEHYNCQYAISVTLEYVKADSSIETKKESFIVKSGVSSVNFLKGIYVNKTSVLAVDSASPPYQPK